MYHFLELDPGADATSVMKRHTHSLLRRLMHARRQGYGGGSY